MYNPPLELWRWHSSYTGLWWGTGELYFISQDCFLCRGKGFNNQQLQPFGRTEGKIFLFWQGEVGSFYAAAGWQASKPKINLLQIVPACHNCNPIPKLLINSLFASTAASFAPLTTLNQWVKRSSEQKFVNRTAPSCHRRIKSENQTFLQACGRAQLMGQIGSRRLLTH